MFKFFVKRIILIIPALLIISAAVFLLSKMMPGKAGILDDEKGAISYQGSTKSQMEARIQYLKKTGQDLPYFYFSVATLAESDTLNRIFPESDRRFLKRMTLKFGNWEVISEYYKLLIALRKIPENTLLKRDDLIISRNRLEALTKSVEKENVLAEFESLITWSEQINSSSLRRGFIEAKDKYLEVVSSKTPLKNFIPVIHFHGKKNQYHQWLSGVIIGDFGTSYRDGRSVLEIIWEALGITLLLTFSSLAISWIIAIYLGSFISNEEHRSLEKPVLATLYVLDTVPLFLLAIMVLLLVTSQGYLGFLPVYGLGEYEDGQTWLTQAFALIPYLILPISCMILVTLPYVTSQVNSAIKEVKTSEFIITARAKGLSEHRIIFRHALRNALIPLITIISGSLPALISGALVVEVIFSIPGMGKLLADSVIARDYLVILGIVLIVAFVKIISQILADFFYYLSDPRIKLSEQ